VSTNFARRSDTRIDPLEGWEVRELLSRSVQAGVRVDLGSNEVPENPNVREVVLRPVNAGTVRVRDWAIEISMPEQFAYGCRPDGRIEDPPGATDSLAKVKRWSFNNSPAGTSPRGCRFSAELPFERGCLPSVVPSPHPCSIPWTRSRSSD
jgi:hypothetical protein